MLLNTACLHWPGVAKLLLLSLYVSLTCNVWLMVELRVGDSGSLQSNQPSQITSGLLGTYHQMQPQHQQGCRCGVVNKALASAHLKQGHIFQLNHTMRSQVVGQMVLWKGNFWMPWCHNQHIRSIVQRQMNIVLYVFLFPHGALPHVHGSRLPALDHLKIIVCGLEGEKVQPSWPSQFIFPASQAFKQHTLANGADSQKLQIVLFLVITNKVSVHVIFNKGSQAISQSRQQINQMGKLI